MANNRWCSLTVACWMTVLCGISYAYGMISDCFKEKLKFTQEDVDFVGSMGNIAQYFGLASGFFYDAYGPEWSVRIGGFLATFGFSALYLATNGFIASSIWHVCGIDIPKVIENKEKSQSNRKRERAYGIQDFCQ